jgi:hypothetical protein
VGGQISQHALGVGAAVDGEKDVHGVWSP